MAPNFKTPSTRQHARNPSELERERSVERSTPTNEQRTVRERLQLEFDRGDAVPDSFENTITSEQDPVKLSAQMLDGATTDANPQLSVPRERASLRQRMEATPALQAVEYVYDPRQLLTPDVVKALREKGLDANVEPWSRLLGSLTPSGELRIGAARLGFAGEKTLTLRDPQTQRVLKRYAVDEPIFSFVLHDDHLVIQTLSGAVNVFSLTSGRLAKSLKPTKAGSLNTLSFAADGSRLLMFDSKQARVWTLSEKKPLSLTLPKDATSVSFLDEGEQVRVVTGDDRIVDFSARSGRVLFEAKVDEISGLASVGSLPQQAEQKLMARFDAVFPAPRPDAGNEAPSELNINGVGRALDVLADVAALLRDDAAHKSAVAARSYALTQLGHLLKAHRLTLERYQELLRAFPAELAPGLSKVFDILPALPTPASNAEAKATPAIAIDIKGKVKAATAKATEAVRQYAFEDLSKDMAIISDPTTRFKLIGDFLLAHSELSDTQLDYLLTVLPQDHKLVGSADAPWGRLKELNIVVDGIDPTPTDNGRRQGSLLLLQQAVMKTIRFETPEKLPALRQKVESFALLAANRAYPWSTVALLRLIAAELDLAEKRAQHATNLAQTLAEKAVRLSQQLKDVGDPTKLQLIEEYVAAGGNLAKFPDFDEVLRSVENPSVGMRLIDLMVNAAGTINETQLSNILEWMPHKQAGSDSHWGSWYEPAKKRMQELELMPKTDTRYAFFTGQDYGPYHLEVYHVWRTVRRTTFTSPEGLEKCRKLAFSIFKDSLEWDRLGPAFRPAFERMVYEEFRLKEQSMKAAAEPLVTPPAMH